MHVTLVKAGSITINFGVCLFNFSSWSFLLSSLSLSNFMYLHLLVVLLACVGFIAD